MLTVIFVGNLILRLIGPDGPAAGVPRSLVNTGFIQFITN